MISTSFNRRIPAVVILTLICGSMGCESVVRKFVRKQKPEERKKEEIVFVPEEYKDQGLAHEELLRQSFLYWKSWQDEAIDSLVSGGSHKRQLECLNEAIKNLRDMTPYLKGESAARLKRCLAEMDKLYKAVLKDEYNVDFLANQSEAERIKREIMRDLSLGRVKGDII